jgi:hypothetical protein
METVVEFRNTNGVVVVDQLGSNVHLVKKGQIVFNGIGSYDSRIRSIVYQDEDLASAPMLFLSFYPGNNLGKASVAMISRAQSGSTWTFNVAMVVGSDVPPNLVVDYYIYDKAKSSLGLPSDIVFETRDASGNLLANFNFQPLVVSRVYTPVSPLVQDLPTSRYMFLANGFITGYTQEFENDADSDGIPEFSFIYYESFTGYYCTDNGVASYGRSNGGTFWDPAIGFFQSTDTPIIVARAP